MLHSTNGASRLMNATGSSENGKGVFPITGFLSTKGGREESSSQEFHFNIDNFQPPELTRRLKSIPNLPENYTQSSYKLPTHLNPFEGGVKIHCRARAISEPSICTE